MPVLALGDDAAEVPRARHWVMSRCAEQGVDEDVLDVLELVTSELVANAYQHGCPPVQVGVERTSAPAQTATGRADGLLLEVSDAGPGAPVVRDADLDALGGRGLALVETLAAAWGVRPQGTGTGKTVWCRLAT